MKQILKRTDVIFKITLFCLFIFLYFVATSYPEKSKKFPQLVCISTTIIIAVSLIFDFSRKEKIEKEIFDVGDTELTKIDEDFKKIRRHRFIKAWAIILISTAIGFLGGFLITTFLLLIGFLFLFGEKGNFLKNITISLLITLIIFFTFQLIFGISLIKGF